MISRNLYVNRTPQKQPARTSRRNCMEEIRLSGRHDPRRQTQRELLNWPHILIQRVGIVHVLIHEAAWVFVMHKNLIASRWKDRRHTRDQRHDAGNSPSWGSYPVVNNMKIKCCEGENEKVWLELRISLKAMLWRSACCCSTWHLPSSRKYRIRTKAEWSSPHE